MDAFSTDSNSPILEYNILDKLCALFDLKN